MRASLTCYAFLLWLGCIQAAPAGAHGANLIVSCDDAKPARLHVNGRDDYLSQSRCSGLGYGTDPLTGWSTDSPGISMLPQDGLLHGRFRLGSGHRLALELLHADQGFSMAVPATWRTVLTHAGQRFELPRDAQGNFGINMITIADRTGTFRATFRFVDLSNRYAPSEPFTLCFVAGAAQDTLSLQASAAPENFVEAVEDLRLRLNDIGAWIGAAQGGRVADEASLLRSRFESLADLARADSSVGVRQIAVVESAAKVADDAVVALHQMTDLNDLESAREHYGRLRNQLAIVTAVRPGQFACPMGCDHGRTYAAPGTCPVCGMKLTDSRAHQDHEPRHGGVFMMSPDLAHHLEATLGAEGVLRLYVYDEYTRPVPVSGVRAHVSLAPTASGKPGSAVELTPSPEGAFLMAQIPPHRPVRVTLVVDFGHGAGEETYEMEFAR